MGVVGQGGVRREVAEKDRGEQMGTREWWREDGERQGWDTGIDEGSVEGKAAKAVGWCTKIFWQG